MSWPSASWTSSESGASLSPFTFEAARIRAESSSIGALCFHGGTGVRLECLLIGSACHRFELCAVVRQRGAKQVLLLVRQKVEREQRGDLLFFQGLAQLAGG